MAEVAPMSRGNGSRDTSKKMSSEGTAKELSSPFPKELFFPLENEPYFLGRLTINQILEEYSVEIDIVNTESKKIFYHVDMLFRRQNYEDAVQEGIDCLSKFLLKPRK